MTLRKRAKLFLEENKEEDNFKNQEIEGNDIIKSCVKPCRQIIWNIIDNNSAFSWFRFRGNLIGLDVLKCWITNFVLLGDIGKEFYMQVVSEREEDVRELKQLYVDAEIRYGKGTLGVVPYDVLKILGYDGKTMGGNSPSEEIISKLDKEYEEKIGLIKNTKGKYCINPNIFQKYFFSRVSIFKYNGDYYIYDLSGYYKKTDIMQINKIAKHMVDDAKSNVWNKQMEKTIWNALNMEIECVNNINVYTKYINFKNGMYNIYTQKLQPHDPKFFSTIRIAVDYNPNAKCPIFEEFLNDLMQGDAERIALLEEIIGYCLTLLKCVQKGFFFYGTGGNGKSKLAELITHLCGKSNVSNVSLEMLGSRFGTENLPEKLLNISAENEFDGKYVNTSNFKTITGGDTINIDAKFKKAKSYNVFVKLISLVNKLPNVEDTSEGYFRRVMIVPFYNVFTGENDDKQIMNKLLNELEGIAALSLKGLKRLVDNDFNFTKSKAVEEIFNKYKIEQNPLIEFFEDKIIHNENVQIKQADVLKHFKKWAVENGYDDWKYITSTRFWNMFRKILNDNGINCEDRKKIKGITYINGIFIQ